MLVWTVPEGPKFAAFDNAARQLARLEPSNEYCPELGASELAGPPITTVPAAHVGPARTSIPIEVRIALRVKNRKTSLQKRRLGARPRVTEATAQKYSRTKFA